MDIYNTTNLNYTHTTNNSLTPSGLENNQIDNGTIITLITIICLCIVGCILICEYVRNTSIFNKTYILSDVNSDEV